MILGETRIQKPGSLEESLSTSGMDALGASFNEAISDNPTTKIAEYYQTKYADIEAIKKKKPFLSRDDATKKANEKGVIVQNLPESISEDALDILIKRQYEKKVRNTVIEKADSTVGNLTGAIAGSLVDPLNIASGFVPVFGQARVAALLARSSGFLAKAGVRAGIGAVEGIAGAAILEPLNYGLSQKLGDDYTSYNSLMNISIGGALGAVLHSGVGAVSDVVKSKLKPTSKIAHVAKQFEGMSVEAREMHLKASIANIVEGKNVDVGLINHAYKMDTIKSLEDLNIKIQKAVSVGDEASVSVLSKRYEALNQTIKDIETTSLFDSTKPSENVVDVETVKINREYIDSNFKDSNGDLDVKKATESIESQIKNSIDRGESVQIKVGDELQEVVDIKNNKLITQDGSEIPFEKAIDQELEIKGIPKENEEGVIAFNERKNDAAFRPDNTSIDLKQYSKSTQSLPNSKYIDSEMNNAQYEKLAELKKTDTSESFQIAEQQSQLELENLKQLALENDLDVSLVLKELDEAMNNVDTYNAALKALANCKLGGGQ